jgi:hypothetical protein
MMDDIADYNGIYRIHVHALSQLRRAFKLHKSSSSTNNNSYNKFKPYLNPSCKQNQYLLRPLKLSLGYGFTAGIKLYKMAQRKLKMDFDLETSNFCNSLTTCIVLQCNKGG